MTEITVIVRDSDPDPQYMSLKRQLTVAQHAFELFRRSGTVVGDDERRVLFLVDADVVTYVGLFHYVPGTGVQEYGVLVELR